MFGGAQKFKCLWMRSEMMKSFVLLKEPLEIWKRDEEEDKAKKNPISQNGSLELRQGAELYLRERGRPIPDKISHLISGTRPSFKCHNLSLVDKAHLTGRNVIIRNSVHLMSAECCGLDLGDDIPPGFLVTVDHGHLTLRISLGCWQDLYILGHKTS
ncbi:hypothetical protein Tco_0223854 [Tanacetum coccineum]